jgi:hypothetical protein
VQEWDPILLHFSTARCTEYFLIRCIKTKLIKRSFIKQTKDLKKSVDILEALRREFQIAFVHMRNVKKCLPCDTRARYLLVPSLYLGENLCMQTSVGFWGIYHKESRAVESNPAQLTKRIQQHSHLFLHIISLYLRHAASVTSIWLYKSWGSTFTAFNFRGLDWTRSS